MKTPLLLQRFPELADRLPWTPLVAGPTPVEPLPGLGRADVWVKRDDRTCPHLYGGNKARKFEWILGDACAKGRNALWTFGGLNSNHCSATACYGHAAGLRVRLLMTPTPLLDEEERNLLRLQAVLGAEQTLLPGGLHLWAALLPAAFSRSANAPYLVPPGGSSAHGVLGYVNAGLELADQIARGQAPRPDVIYIAAASHGTVLGLAIGLRLAGLNAPNQPHIIAVETTTPGWQAARRHLLRTPERAHAYLRRHSANARRALPKRFADLRPDVDRRFEHLPLGVMTSELADALAFARNEADLILDVHFSAKAFAALRADLSVGRHASQTVLFWHTHGQIAPELRAAVRNSPAANLPPTIARAASTGLARGAKKCPNEGAYR